MPPRNHYPRPPGAPSKYPPKLKAEALQLYGELGAAETSRRLGVPGSTLRQWASVAGVRAPANELAARFTKKTPPTGFIEEGTPDSLETVSNSLVRAEQTEAYDKDEFARLWVRVGRASGRALEKAIRNGDSMAAQRLNNVAGTATDKLQLLNGGPTSRRETGASPAELDARITAMLQAIRARHAAGALDANSRPSETGPAVAVEQPRVLPAAALEHPGRIPDRPPLPHGDNPGGPLGGQAPGGPGPLLDGGPIPDRHVGDDEQGRR